MGGNGHTKKFWHCNTLEYWCQTPSSTTASPSDLFACHSWHTPGRPSGAAMARTATHSSARNHRGIVQYGLHSSLSMGLGSSSLLYSSALRLLAAPVCTSVLHLVDEALTRPSNKVPAAATQAAASSR